MKFTLAPAIIVLSAGSVNKNFHYAPRGGALVQITPKLSSGILLLFSPHYNNIIPKQQELVKVYYRELVGIILILHGIAQITWNSSNLCSFRTCCATGTQFH